MKRARRIRARIIKSLIVFVGSVVVLLLVVGVFLVLGGAKTALEIGLSAAMNGYVTVDEASYFYFGKFKAKNLSMVLDWEGKQEIILSARTVMVQPRILPLLGGRLTFGTAIIDDADLNLRVLPDGLANIDRLFRLEPEPPEPAVQVFPPHWIEVTNMRLSFAPYTYGPIQIDKISGAFCNVDHRLSDLFNAVIAFLMAIVVIVGLEVVYID